MRRDGWGGWSRFQPSGARRTRWGWRDHPPGAQARALAVPSERLPPTTCRARRAASPRGVQAVGANESAPRVGQVLEELDEKLYRGEELRVGVEIVGVGSAIDHGIRAPLVEEQMLEGDRRANDVLCERFASLRGAGREVDRCVETYAN